MTSFVLYCRQIVQKFNRDEMTVYAAQASFFIILSVFPFLMLLLTLVQIIPGIQEEDLIKIVLAYTPSLSTATRQLTVTIINDLYTKSPGTILSVTAITALWSASRGMLSMERGLDRVHGSLGKRNYLLSRLVCAGYTILFMLACVMSLLLLVFGDLLQRMVMRFFPFLAQLAAYILNFRALWTMTLLTLCFVGLYTYVPRKPMKLRQQLPGAVFSSLCWIGFSFGFSIYFNHFSNYSYMYGSLTAIVLVMLWLYFCLCILFAGAEINYFYEHSPD